MKASFGGRGRTFRPNGFLLPIASLALVTLFGCVTEKSAPRVPNPMPESAKVVQEATQASARTIEITPERIAEGKALFMTCGACHGVNGEGKVGMGPTLASPSFLAAATDEFLVNTIANGRAGTTMIAWSGMYQPSQIESLVAYIRSETPTDAAVLDESPLKGDAAKGEVLYREICSACHGNSGAGYMETANGTGIGRSAFLDTASNGFIRHIAKHGKDQTAMRPFTGARASVANLSDEEIDNVITYLRKSAW